MIRSLKVLIAAAMALTALGAISATGAHAAEEKWHCSVKPCTLTLAKDGTTTKAHHVFVVKGESLEGVPGSTDTFTCESLSGEFTSAEKTLTSATFKNLKYNTCKISGSVFTVDMNSCTYKFNSTGGGTAAGSEVHLECEKAGDGIVLTFSGVECVKVTPLTTTGIKYHDAGTTKEVMTAEVSNIPVPKAAVELLNIGSIGCEPVNLKTVEEAKYITGNTNVTAEPDSCAISASVWFE